MANGAFSTPVANHVLQLGFEPGFETAASCCHMGLQLMFGYLVGNLRLENRFTQGWKIGLQTSYSQALCPAGKQYSHIGLLKQDGIDSKHP